MSGDTWRVEFHAKGSAESIGMPAHAFTALFEVLGKVTRGPWEHSDRDWSGDDDTFRYALFGDGLGVVQFRVDDEQRVVRVHGITWAG